MVGKRARIQHGLPRREEAKKAGFDKAALMARIAICRVFGQTRDQSAVSVGISLKMLEKWSTENRAFLNEFEEFVRAMKPAPSVIEGIDFADVTDEKSFLKKLDSQFGPMFVVLVRALQDGDIKVAMGAVAEIGKMKGLTTTTKVKHTGKIEHEERIVHDVTPAMAKLVNQMHQRNNLPPAFKEADVVSGP